MGKRLLFLSELSHFTVCLHNNWLWFHSFHYPTLHKYADLYGKSNSETLYPSYLLRTLEERAQRLFSTKGKSLESLDTSLFAKNPKSKGTKRWVAGVALLWTVLRFYSHAEFLPQQPVLLPLLIQRDPVSALFLCIRWRAPSLLHSKGGLCSGHWEQVKPNVETAQGTFWYLGRLWRLNRFQNFFLSLFLLVTI